MFIRLEIRAKEYIDPCVATGKKSYESDDIVLNSDSVISAHRGHWRVPQPEWYVRNAAEWTKQH